MAVVDVGIVINARDNATATINRVRNAINQLGGRGGGGGGGSGVQGLSGGFAGAGRSMFGFLSRLNTVAAAAFVAYHSVRTLFTGLAEFAAEAQRASQALIVTTGSIENAQREFARLVQTFTPAGFAIENMVLNFNALRGAGLGVEDANRTLEATAAAIAAFGGTQAQMDRATIALSQIGAKGVATMEELRGQLSEAVPIALAIMADQAGISIRELTDNVKKGLVSSEEAIRLFTQGAEELFEGLLEAQRETLTGAVNEMKNAVSVGLADLFQRTDLDERLVVMFQEITQSILSFFASIDQDKIDAFFEVMNDLDTTFRSVFGVLESLNPLFELLGQALGPLGGLLLNIVRALADFTSLAISTAIFAVFKLAEAFSRLKGDVLGAEVAMRAAESAQRGMQRSFDRLNAGDTSDPGLSAEAAERQARARERLEESARRVTEMQRRQAEFNRQAEQATREQLRLQERLRDLVAETNAQYQGSLLSFADNLDRIAARVGDIFDVELRTFEVRNSALAVTRGMTIEQIRQQSIQALMARGFSQQIAEIRSNAVAAFLVAAEKFRTEMADALDEVRIAQLDAFSDITGGSIEAAALRVTLQFRRQQRELETMLQQVQQLNERTGTEADTIAAINALLARNNELRAIAVQHAEQMQALAQQELLVRRQIETAGIEAQSRREARETNDNPFVQIGAGTNAGRMIEEVNEMRRRLSDSVAELQLQLQRLNIELQNATGENADSIRAQIAAITGLIGVQTSAMEKLSENAVLSRKLWQDVGRTIEEGVGDAIYGVVTGTQTLEDVGLQMFNALTRAAIDYIVQLIIIQTLKAASSFANGGVVGGGSTPVKMAAGGTAINGIVRGPTMFQAGEAGEEGIFPLTRVNGKLGIRATGMGGGGDNYHISIHAIDTQTGIDFLMKNRAAIVSGLRKEMFLNRGIDRVRP